MNLQIIGNFLFILIYILGIKIRYFVRRDKLIMTFHQQTGGLYMDANNELMIVCSS